MRHNLKHLLRGVILSSLLTSLAFFAGSEPAFSQSTSQVTITGIPPVLQSPFADDIENNFRTGRYQVIFTYSSFSNQPVDFVFDFSLRLNNRELINVTSLPKSFSPGTTVFSSFFEELQFNETADEVISRLDRNITNQIVQTGFVPEGDYMIEITARPFTGQSGISALPGSAMFSVRYLSPPILISIPDQSNITSPTPIFSWTPVVSSIGGVFDFDFLLVPVLDGQTALRAIESNRALAQESLTGRTSLPYTQQFLPLEEGERYAWQVTAKDPAGRIPFQNDGKSEIYTFTYNADEESDGFAELSTIEELTLIPNFATLINLERMRVREEQSYYEIDGPAELQLEFDLAEEMTVPVQVTGLRIQKGSEANPIITAGELSGDTQNIDSLFGATAGIVVPEQIRWRVGENVTITAGLSTGDGETFSAEGILMLDRTGLTGRVSAETDDHFADTQTHPLRAELTNLSASYPGAVLSGSGNVYLLENELCSQQSFSFSGESFSTFIDCTPELEMELVEGSDLLTWQVQSLSGQLSGTWNSEELEYDLMLDNELSLKLDEDILQAERCGLSTTLRLDDENGFSAENITPDCSFPDPYLDLGIYKLQYSNPELSIFELGENGDLDFELLFDGQLFLPTLTSIAFPLIESIAIKPSGIHFPEFHFDDQTLQPFTTFAIDAFELAFTRFAVDEQQFPWFEWDGDGPGPLQASFDANLNFPDSGKFPACLRNAAMEVSEAEVDINGITGDIEADIIDSCRWEIGARYAIHIEDADGELSLLYQDRDINTLSNINIEGAIELGPPFTCDTTEPEIIPFEDTNFQFKNNGFSTEIEDIIPGCPVQVGPYLATVTGSELTLDFSSDGDDVALLAADATLDLGTETDATGSFTLNLLTGEFIDLNFEIDESFEWGIPKENPVLVFDIDRAVVNESGLYINGRQSLLIDDETMGVTFDELTVDWSTFEVISGRIIFDEAFTFEAGIDQTTSELSYSATMRDSSLTLTPGVLLTLAGAAVIDSDGLKTSGQSQGELKFSDIEVDDVEVTFSDQFSMGLDPFGVQSGSAELYWDDQRIAIIDPSGFRPDIGFLGEEFLPERVPLPTEEVAYLEIKRDGQLLVDATDLGDGSYRIDTRAGEPLKMVLPGLQGTNPAPPEVDVTLTDFIINPSTGTYISGTARAAVSDVGPEFDLESLGIPLTLDELIFTTQQIAQGDLTALFLNGTITLLDHEFGDAGSATLFIQNDGRVKGTLSLSGLNEQLRLQPGSDRVVYELEALAGYVDIPITVTGSPDYQFDMGGRFLVQDLNDQPVASASLQSRLTEQGFSITEFDASDFTQSSTLDLEFFRFTIDQISSLSLSYSSQNGFDFNAGLDMQIDLLPSGGSAIEIPLKNVEIRSDDGIVIPAQNIHDGSMPLMDAPVFDLGIFRLQPLAFRTEPYAIDIFDLNVGDLIGLAPEMDLEVTFHSFSGTSPELNQIALSIYEASFDNGILAGTVYPYDIFGDPIVIPIGPAGIAVDLLEGRLYATDEGAQGMEIDLEGLFQMPDNFGNEGQPCRDTRVAFSLSLNGGFTGRAEQFMPCGQLVLGPLSLGFDQSVLDLSFENDQQSATLSGTANAEIERDGQPPVQASGNLSYDLMNGSILSGSVGIDEPFTWGVPVEDPLFEFTVQTAAINTAGLIFNGNGNLATGDGSVGVLFNNLAFHLSDGELTSGDVQIQNEFAVDIEFGPTRWSVTDPSSDIEYDSGIRLGFPSNITIDSDGFSATGQSTASIRYAGEVYDDLQVNFVDMAVGLSPVSVVSGRADLMLNDERLAYYDSGGFHLDNLAGAITSVMPDTLGLPSKDIAYIVLKNEQGESLVQTMETGAGLEISTTNPMPLVLAGLGESDSDAPRVDVTFSELVINDSFEVISGSITADVSDTPVNMDDFPIGLMAVHYKKEAGQSYKLYADARMQLPESLSDLSLLVENIILGPDGFRDTGFSTGAYTTTHTEGSAEPVTTHSFDDGDFEISVRGVEMAFGANPTFKFSGDLSSTFLSNSNGEPAILHFSSEHSSGNWTFALDADHISPREVPIGDATLVLEELDIDTNTGFDVAIDGRLKMPNVLGSDFAIGFNGLRVGTSGVSLESGSADGTHEIGLFGQSDNLTLSNPNLSIQNNHLQLLADGNLNILDRDFSFTGLQIGTDGTFHLSSGSGNLVGEDVSLMEEFLVLNSLNLGVQNNKIQLTAGLTASMPEPLESSTKTFDLTIDNNGEVSSNGLPYTLSISFDDDGGGVEIGDIATFNLTGAGLKIKDIHDLDMTLFASADLIIDEKTIQFGTSGGADNYGIRYQTTENKLEWRITDSPSFEFNTDILRMEIDNVSPIDGDSQAFGVSLNTKAWPKLPGVEGDGLTLHGFTITTDGIGSMGDVQGGSFTLASVITFELGKFEWGRNETVSVTNHEEYQDNPDIDGISNEQNQTGTVEVDEYLKFSPTINSGKAIKISLPGGFSGQIQELFYYRNDDSFYLNIEGVVIEMGDHAQLTASLEYLSQPDGFKLMVAGGGTLKSPLGNDSAGFAALGTMSNIDDQFRFGIFVKLTAEIPIVPGILSLAEVGAGFFYNPEDSDFDHIINTAGHSFENEIGGTREKPWTRSSADFGIAVYARATLISSLNVAEGSAILFLTNTFFYVDMDATLLGMGNEFRAGINLSVQWSDNFLVKGSAYAKMGIDPLLSSTMEMSFVVGTPEGESEFIWGFTASADFKILSFLNANGEIMVSNTGFYVGVKVNGGFDIWVISVSASFEAQVWWIYGNPEDRNQFGAYVEIDVNATLFKVATVGANLKGALIVDSGSGFLIYAEARAYVSILFVFKGNVSIWAAIRNGKVSGGKGSNSEYTSMINEARRNAQSIKDQMDNLMAQLDEISGAIEILKMTDEELDNAGQTLVSLSRIAQWLYFDIDLDDSNTNHRVHERIKDHIVGSDPSEWRSVSPGAELNTLLEEMNQKIDDLKTINESVKGRFEEAYELALEWDSEAMDLLDDLGVKDPVNIASFGSLNTDEKSDVTGNIPEFDIDQNVDKDNQTLLNDYRKQVAKMEVQFREAIESVREYIRNVDLSLSATYETIYDSRAGAVEVQIQPAASDVADQYVETTTAIDKYYGNLVSHFWETSEWTRNKYNNFENLAANREDVIDANENILNDIWSFQGLTFEFIPGPEGEEKLLIRDYQNNLINLDNVISIVDLLFDTSDENIRDARDAMIDTRSIMERRQFQMFGLAADRDYDDPSFNQNQSEFKTRLDEFIYSDQRNFGSFFGTFIRKGVEYWYEIPKRGLLLISESTAFTADSLASDYKRNVQDVVRAHNNFTNTLDDIYTVKSSLTLTLHGIVDLYISELEAASESVENVDAEMEFTFDLDETLQQMGDLKEEIEGTLQPPKIDNIYVDRHLRNYNNKVGFKWNASHPSGSISEYSYMMMDESLLNDEVVTMQVGRMLSTGNQNSVTRYLFKENEDQISKTMQVLVRARGPSGTAISRPGSFTVSVDKNDGLSNTDATKTSNLAIQQPDGSPPIRPTVRFDYEESRRSRHVFNRIINPITGVTYNEWDVVEEEVYWTNIADRIEFDVYSIDPESDISGFEYALGSSVSETDIRGWTRIQGLNIESELWGLRKTNLNDWQRIRIQNLDLSEQDHYLSIRAINGEGLESTKRFVSQPIVYSGEPPVVRDFNEVQLPELRSGQLEAHGPLTEAPSFQISHWSDRVSPELEVSWLPAVSTAMFNMSGIQRYEYIVSDLDDAEEAFGQAESVHVSTNNTATLLESDGISYTEDFYVHLRAFDKAGNMSENTSTLGPLVVPDPTRPDTPIIRATHKPNGIGFYLQGPAMDRETSIERYEYTIAKVGGLNIIPWTEIDVRNPLNTIYPGSKPIPSYTPIPLTGVDEGIDLLIKVRAVNKQGISSSEAWSFPITYDTSPPKKPTINLSKSGNTMTIGISNLHDPESGVKRVEYLVCNVTDYGGIDAFCGDARFDPWRELANYSSGRKSPFQLSKQVTISGSLSSKKVFVRVTNRNGMQTTASYKPAEIFIFPSQDQTDESDYDLNLNIFNFNF